MVFDRENAQVITIEHVDESVRGIDSSAPDALQSAFQWFGFADSLKGGPQSISNERIDSFERSPVLRLPIRVVVPCIIRPAQYGSVLHEWVRGAAAADLVHAALNLVMEI